LKNWLAVVDVVLAIAVAVEIVVVSQQRQQQCLRLELKNNNFLCDQNFELNIYLKYVCDNFQYA